MWVEDDTAGEAAGAEAFAGGLVTCAEVDGVGVGVGCADGVGTSEMVGDGATDGAVGEGVSLTTGPTTGVRAPWRDCAKPHVPTDKAIIATTTQMTAARH